MNFICPLLKLERQLKETLEHLIATAENIFLHIKIPIFISRLWPDRKHIEKFLRGTNVRKNTSSIGLELRGKPLICHTGPHI